MWRQLFHRACRDLGWSPRTFWQSTPLELATALFPPSSGAQAEALGRDGLTALLSRFPDIAGKDQT